MMSKTKIALVMLALLRLMPACQVFAQCASELALRRAAELCEALRSRDTEPLTPLLAGDCRVQDHDRGMGPKVLRAIAAQLTVDTLYVTEVIPGDGRTRVEGEMLLNGAVKPVSFALDGEGLFSEITLVKAVIKAENRLEPFLLASVTELPFVNRNGFIVLEEGILVDGRQGVFVLDSGAIRTLLNSASTAAAASMAGSGVMSRRGVVSSVTQSAQLVRVDSLLVGGNLFRLRGAAIDLTQLARSMELEELTGLIGADLLRNFETHIDYRKGVVRLYELAADGTAPAAPEPRRRLGFELLSDHLPVFGVDADGRSLRMLFDTGAQSCCLTPAAAAQLGPSFRSGEKVQLRDADAAVQVVSGKIGTLDWGGVKRRGVACVVRDLSAIGEIDGILGYPMVARRHISLNYVRRELCFY